MYLSAPAHKTPTYREGKQARLATTKFRRVFQSLPGVGARYRTHLSVYLTYQAYLPMLLG